MVGRFLVGGWTNPYWQNLLVKMDHLPRDPRENKKMFEATRWHFFPFGKDWEGLCSGAILVSGSVASMGVFFIDYNCLFLFHSVSRVILCN